MKFYCRYHVTPFSPAEVERITGVSALLQRTWRKRGFITKQEFTQGWFGAAEVAQILALRDLSHGLTVDLEFVKEAAEKAAPIILWYALGSERVHQVWDVRANKEMRSAFFKAIGNNGLSSLLYVDKMLGVKQDDILPYLVRTPKGIHLVGNLTEFFENDMSPSAVVANLMLLGHALAERVKKPLMLAGDVEVR